MSNGTAIRSGLGTAATLLLLVAACHTTPTQIPAETPSQEPIQEAVDHSQQSEPESQPHEQVEGDRPVRDYGSPAPTIYFVAGLKGFIEPCGCTAGLHVGGLDKLVGYIEVARRAQPASIVLDGGDMLFQELTVDDHLLLQEREKASLIVEGLQRLGARATVLGPRDMALGLDFYLDTISPSGITVLGANIRAVDGRDVADSAIVVPVGDTTVGVVGVVDPALFDSVAELRADAPIAAVRAALAEVRHDVDLVILLAQGNADFARGVASQVDGLDFLVVGHDPEETDGVATVGDTSILQAYDQGRYVGILKLYEGGAGPFQDARIEDREAVERIDRRLSYLRSQLALLPPSPQGEEPPIILSMREQVDELLVEREEVRNGNLVFPAEGNAFLYWPVPLEPGYPIDTPTAESIREYNDRLHQMNASQVDIVPLGDEVAFTGDVVCRVCHASAYESWAETPHARAVDTLRERGKEFDEVCISCHVTGFREPGGSVTGNHNNLGEVQCEACHGRGAEHVEETSGGTTLTPPAAVCLQCHTPEHSPTFSYDIYLPLVVGPGHGVTP